MLANYANERKAIKQISNIACVTRVLTIHGRRQSGKSELLRWLCSEVGTDCLVAIVGFKGVDPITSGVILELIVDAFGRNRFPKYEEELRRERQHILAQVHNCTVVGHGNSFIASGGETLEDRERTAIRLADTLVAELKNSHSAPMIIAFDSVELCSARVLRWIRHKLFPKLFGVPMVRVVLSGQDVPNEDGWANGALRVDLRGVNSAQDWLDYARAVGRKAPCDAAENQETFMKAVVMMAEGVPGLIVAFIATWPLADNE